MTQPSFASTRDIVDAIENTLELDKNSSFPVVLHEPNFEQTSAWTYVKNCLDTGWVSTAGEWVNRFEDSLRSVTGASYAIAVSNGTVALRLALHLVGVTRDDEVLVPPFSFVATANAVSHLGAIPHFVDIDKMNLGMNPVVLENRLLSIAIHREGKLINRETGRRIACILPVHIFGHPAYLTALRNVADEWNLPLVEDAAEALGSWRGETHCGLFGDIGTLSFNGNKLITTGGGGALLTNNLKLASRARHLSTTAKLQHPWEYNHDEIGWNDRLPNINAALGVAQLEKIDNLLLQKRRLALRYINFLKQIDGVEVLQEPRECQSNYWLVSLRFTSQDLDAVDRQMLDLLNYSHKRISQTCLEIISSLPMYSECPKTDLSCAEDQVRRIVNLPSSP